MEELEGGMALCVVGAMSVVVACGVRFTGLHGPVPVDCFVVISFAFCCVVADCLVASRAISVVGAYVASFYAIFSDGGGGEEELAGVSEDAGCEGEGEVVVC